MNKTEKLKQDINQFFKLLYIFLVKIFGIDLIVVGFEIINSNQLIGILTISVGIIIVDVAPSYSKAFIKFIHGEKI